MTIDVHTLPPTEQIFTHVEPGTGANTTIATTSLQTHLRAISHPMCRIPLTVKDAKLLLTFRGIEKHRLARLTALCRYYPILVLEWADGTHLIADGTHSYCWQFAHGSTSALAWLVPRDIWEPFIVTGLPETTEQELLSSFSGIR